VRELAKGEVRITGPETEQNTVAADILVQTLQRLQKLVFIAAGAREGSSLKRRFKPTTELRLRHTLRCALPRGGSYAIAIAEVDERSQSDLPQMNGYAALDDVYDLADAVINEDAERAKAIIPESSFRRLMLRTLQEMAPSEGSAWNLELTVGDRTPRRVAYALRRDVHRMLRQDQPEEQEEGSVIGQLQRIFFDIKKIVIQHPVTETLIECFYDDEIEADIWESRRDYVQVTGRVTRTPEGHVSTVTDVTSIERVDTSPFQIAEIESDELRLRLTPPLEVVAELDEETRQVFLFSDDSLNLHVAAASRAGLYEEVVADLLFSYREYALTPDEELSPAAAELKQRLLQRLKKEPAGAA